MATSQHHTFEAWMKEVDKALDKLIGCDNLGLPDIDYYALYDEGASAITAARAAIEFAMYN